jgi:hypothetical protein
VLQSVQCSHYIFSSQALTHLHSYALPGEHVDDRQRTEAAPILQLICDEVDAPALVRFLSQKSFFAMLHSLPPLLRPFLQGQTLFLVEPVDQMLAHLPALTSQQHQNLPVSVTHPTLRNLRDTRPQLRPFLLVTLVAIGAPHQTQNPAGMPLAGPILVAQIINQWPAPQGLHHFFRSTS